MQFDVQKIAARYEHIVHWSDEDRCYIGEGPELFSASMAMTLRLSLAVHDLLRIIIAQDQLNGLTVFERDRRIAQLGLRARKPNRLNCPAQKQLWTGHSLCNRACRSARGNLPKWYATIHEANIPPSSASVASRPAHRTIFQAN
jgi:hypothetical protein